jgi:phage shock protein E
MGANPYLVLLLAVAGTIILLLSGAFPNGENVAGGNAAAEEQEAIANQVVRTIPASQAFALIEQNGQNQDFIIIDVRRPDEFAGGHIASAINIDSSRFSEQLPGLDPNTTYIICCLRGGRSAAVRKLMRDAGFREVYEIEGGISAWEAAGFPVVRDQCNPRTICIGYFPVFFCIKTTIARYTKRHVSAAIPARQSGRSGSPEPRRGYGTEHERTDTRNRGLPVPRCIVPSARLTFLDY